MRGLARNAGRIARTVALSITGIATTIAAGGLRLVSSFIREFREVRQLADQTGLGERALDSIRDVFERADSSADAFVDTLVTFRERSIEAAEGSEDVITNLGRLGLGIDRLGRLGKAKVVGFGNALSEAFDPINVANPREFTNALFAALQSVPNTLERASLASILFGDTGREVAGVVTRIEEQIGTIGFLDNAETRIRQIGDAVVRSEALRGLSDLGRGEITVAGLLALDPTPLDKDTAEAAESIDETLRDIGDTLSSIKNDVLVATLPSIAGFLKNIEPNIANISDKVANRFTSLFGSFLITLDRVLPLLSAAALKAIGLLPDNLGDLLGSLAGASTGSVLGRAGSSYVGQSASRSLGAVLSRILSAAGAGALAGRAAGPAGYLASTIVTTLGSALGATAGYFGGGQVGAALFDALGFNFGPNERDEALRQEFIRQYQAGGSSQSLGDAYRQAFNLHPLNRPENAYAHLPTQFPETSQYDQFGRYIGPPSTHRPSGAGNLAGGFPGGSTGGLAGQSTGALSTPVRLLRAFDPTLPSVPVDRFDPGALGLTENIFRKAAPDLIAVYNALYPRGYHTWPINDQTRSMLHYGLIPYLAQGGIVRRPTVAMIGESGPEAVVPLNRGGGVGAHVEVNVYGSVVERRSLRRYIESAVADAFAAGRLQVA